MAWPTDLTKLLKRISLPAEEVFKGLRVLGDYNKTNMDAQDATVKAYILSVGMAAPLQRFMPHTALTSPIFVNGSTGSNSNDGLSRTTPLLTLTAAIAKQTDENKHLYIFVERFYQPAGETWPIVFDKNNVHVIGMGGPNGTWCFIKPVGDYAGVRFDADRCEIAGFEIGGGATSGCIEFGAYNWGNLIRDCWFGVTNTTQGRDGIWTEGGLGYHTYYATVIRCMFGKNLTRDGIRLDSDASSSMLGLPGMGNIFKQINGVAINDTGGFFPDGMCCDNVFGLAADTKGDAITSASARTIFDGNRANTGRTAMSANPYLDTGTGHWLNNYKANTHVLPATS